MVNLEFKDYVSLALAFLVIALTISIGSEVTDRTGDNIEYTILTTYEGQKTNLNFNSSANIYLDLNLSTATISMVNGSNVLIDSGNYSVSAGTGEIAYNTVAKASGSMYNFTDVYVNYTYIVWNTAARNTILNGTGGLQELSGWLPTIGLILAASLIIGTVARTFNFKKD